MNLTLRWALLYFLIIILFFGMRLTNLLALPPFVDETSYLFWTDRVIQERDLTRPMHDGTGPVFMLLAAPLVLLTKNYLLSGRLLSFLADFVILLLAGRMTRMLFHRQKIELMTMLFFALNPLVFVQGRLAILDPLTSMWSILAIYTILNLLTKSDNKIQSILLLGLFLTLGFLTKPISLAILPFILILSFLPVTDRLAKNLSLVNFLTITAGLLLAFIVCLLVFFPYQKEFFNLYQNYHKNTTDTLPNTISTSFLNLKRQASWLVTYFTFPISLLLCLSFVPLVKNKKKGLVFLLFWIASIVLTNALVGTTNIFPRHLIQIALPCIILLAVTIVFFSSMQRWPTLLIAIMATTLMSFIDATFIFRPEAAPLPREDRYQLFEDWTSGYGLQELASFVNKNAENGTSFITDDHWLAHSLRLFYSVNVPIIAREDLFFQRPDKLPEELNKQDSFFVLNRIQTPPTAWRLTPVWSYHAPPRKPISIYQISPSR